MNRRLQAGAFLAVAAVAGLAGFYFNRASPIPPASPLAEASVQRLLSAPLSDLGGKQQVLSQWRGKVLVLNFWATWCAPCREEIPVLMKAQMQYGANGVKIVGIALDNADKVMEYAAEMHINYTLLIGGVETMVLAKDLGNLAGVLPFSLVLDRTGKVVYTHAGKMTEVSLRAILSPLL